MDATTIFLAQAFGVYFIIVGVIALIRRESLVRLFASLPSHSPALYAFALVELFAGIVLVIVYPTVELSVSGIISLIGYMLAVESIVYLIAPFRMVRRMFAKFNQDKWYLIGGVVSVALGA
ncbi:hypothetical protein A2673_02115, partial [Candidatus Kaiserbacteria bacterium RIFCSPHIGHO2_01_FULL_50_13]